MKKISRKDIRLIVENIIKEQSDEYTDYKEGTANVKIGNNNIVINYGYSADDKIDISVLIDGNKQDNMSLEEKAGLLYSVLQGLVGKTDGNSNAQRKQILSTIREMFQGEDLKNMTDNQVLNFTRNNRIRLFEPALDSLKKYLEKFNLNK